tara:strand:- start:238 stop:1344 length:1107 start_codon:yes stop_codon:yes gene_type:complete
MKNIISQIKEAKKLKKLKNSFKNKIPLIESYKERFINFININSKGDLIRKPLDFFVFSQNYLEQKLQKSDKSVLLKRSNVWIKYITGSLISGTIFGIGWLSVAKTEEIVIVQGKLEPISGVINVQMPIEGITQEILVKEGDLVKKGQVLVTLDKDITSARQKTLKKRYEINQGVLVDLEKLEEEGAISKLQYLEQLNKTLELERQLEENEILMGYQQIKAPISGLIFDLQPQKPGFVAATGEPFLKIVPSENLVAKIEIDSRSIGFVTTGKKAAISIDSYPATDFGVIEGEVTTIGSDALPPDPREGKGYRFPAEIELEKQFLSLKNGKKLPLQVGMSLTANIKLRKVSYLQLLLGTFQDKADSLRSI